jgi:cytochrome c oxidase subunit 3
MSDDLFERSPGGGRREPSFRMSARQLAVVVFFASLTVLFAASIVAYAVTRAQNETWRTVEMPPLPKGLIGSTLLLVGVTASAHAALRAVRRNRSESLLRALLMTFAFALAFLGGQALNWRAMEAAQLAPGVKTLYAFTFYMLTGLHALHVLGGFVPLAIVIARARRREYSSSRYEGVRFCVQYWDFLGVVWLVLLTSIYLMT